MTSATDAGAPDTSTEGGCGRIRHAGDDNDGMGQDTEVTPFVILLLVGFVVGAYGHAGKMRWLIGLGILIIVVAVVLFQIEVFNGGKGKPTPPGV